MSEVRVWLIRTSQPRSLFDELLELLDPAERDRAMAIIAPGRQEQFVVAHGAVRQLLGALLEVEPASLRWRYGRHGKPELIEAGLHCNLSHSGGLAALAVSSERAVGIDVQLARQDADPGRLAVRYYPPNEAYSVISAASPAESAARFSQLWSRKEACVKVGGGRLIPSLRWPGTGDQVTGPAGSYHVRDLDVPAGFHGAVAAVGSEQFPLVQSWWEPSTQTVRPQIPDPIVV
jgi:4'-phosphopantetheinyl transferase